MARSSPLVAIADVCDLLYMAAAAAPAVLAARSLPSSSGSTGGRDHVFDERLKCNSVLAEGDVEQVGGRVSRRVGDRRWRERLDQHDNMTSRQITRFGRHLVKVTGDGVLATFDGPARSVQCALAIYDAVRQIGMTIRAGVHAGEIEQRSTDIAGIAVHIAQRICNTAEPGQTLVSRTITDLAAGSGIDFDDHSEHHLKGLDGTWQLYRDIHVP